MGHSRWDDEQCQHICGGSNSDSVESDRFGGLHNTWIAKAMAIPAVTEAVFPAMQAALDNADNREDTTEKLRRPAQQFLQEVRTCAIAQVE